MMVKIEIPLIVKSHNLTPWLPCRSQDLRKSYTYFMII